MVLSTVATMYQLGLSFQADVVNTLAAADICACVILRVVRSRLRP